MILRTKGDFCLMPFLLLEIAGHETPGRYQDEDTFRKCLIDQA